MRHLLVALTIGVAALAGCGGGGSKTTATPTTVTTVAPSAPEATTAWVSPCESPGVCDSHVSKVLETAAGWRYRITAAFDRAEPTKSPGSCIGTPPLGMTNAWFKLNIENLRTDRSGPIPELVFGSNIGASGTVEPAITNVDGSNINVRSEASPNASDTRCILAGSLRRAAGQIGAAASSDFTLVLGPVPDPLPSGFKLLVRAFPTGAGNNYLDWSVPAASGVTTHPSAGVP